MLIGLFRKNYGASFYMIPYKSTVQALQGTVAGDVNVVTYAAGGAASLVRAGKLRALGYTGDRRHPDFPDVPTFEEEGIKMGFKTWIGFFAPAASDFCCPGDRSPATLGRVCTLSIPRAVCHSTPT